MDSFIVDFEKGDLKVIGVGRDARGSDLEKVAERAKVDPPVVGGALHRVRLPRSCLPVRKDADLEGR